MNSGALLVDNGSTKDGVLAFRIVEGKITRIEIRGLERLRDKYVTWRLLPRPGDPLNLDALRERFQLLLDDPLFAKINAHLMPDTNAGDAVLDLDIVRANPYQLTLYANNYRPPSIGSNAVGFGGNVRDLTGFGDLLEFNYQQAPHGKPEDHTMLGWRVPVNRYGTTISVRFEQGKTIVLEAPLSALNITSRLNSRDIGISQPIFESLRNKLSVGVNSVDETVKSSLLGEGFSFTPGVPDGVTKAHLWKFWQEYTHRTEARALVIRSTFSRESNNNVDAGTSPRSIVTCCVISATLAPRDRSDTGLAKPCNNGPMARAPANCCVSL